MSEQALEPIISRIIRLNQLILGRCSRSLPSHHLLHRDGLLDALLALYEECNTIHMKKNLHVAVFVDKIHNVIAELQSMRVSVSDFEVKKVIGRGNFGEVQVVREKATGDVYAMKVLRKAETLAHQCVAFYEEERDIMAKSTSPWVTKLQYAFQDALHLYLIMEFHPGGDMLSLLEKHNVLSEDMARFYLAELVLAINSVHAMGYAHRDIKPDNILIDRTGHIKLADFGSASKLNDKGIVTSKMPVGTPDYIAPEVLVSMNDGRASKKGYGTECDWWSFGIVTYEMMFGVTPFANEKLLFVYNNIMNFKNSLTFPEDEQISSDLKNLIEGLLAETDERFGYKQLIDHPFFSEVDWNNIRQTAPPYVPTVTSQDDTSNFDDFDHDVCRTMLDLEPKKEFSGKNLPFIGFTYVTPFESSSERSLGSEGNLNSPSGQFDPDAVSRKKLVTELQNKVAEMTSSASNLKADLQKIQNSAKKKEKKFESEICRLEDEIIALQSDKKEMMRLLRLEREDRVLTERKASQILKCMKKRKRKSGAPNMCDGKGDGKNEVAISLQEQLDEAISRLEDSDEEGKLRGSFVFSKSLSPRYLKVDDTDSDLASSIKTLQDENEDLRNELKEVEKTRDEAILQVEALKRSIIKLEFDLREAEQMSHQPPVIQSSNSEATSVVSLLEKKLEARDKTIAELQTKLLDTQDKCINSEKRAMAAEKKLSELTTAKRNMDAVLKEAKDKEMKLNKEVEQLVTLVDTLKIKLNPVIVGNSSNQNGLPATGHFSSSPQMNKTEDLSAAVSKENARLLSKISELETQVKSLQESSASTENRPNFGKQLKEKEDTISELQLDLRIANREKKRLEDTLSVVRDSNRQLREKFSNSEKLVEEKCNLEMELKKKIDKLEAEMSSKKQGIGEKIKMYESHKDVSHMYVKSQGQYEEIAKQNEKLKSDYSVKETEKSRMATELETLKKQLSSKEKACANHEKIISALKNTCSELEDQLKEFEALEKAWEADLIEIQHENKELTHKLKVLQNERDRMNLSLSEEKKLRLDLQQQLDDLEDEFENQQSVHETELRTLNEQINHQKKTVMELEAHMSELGNELSLQDHDTKVTTRKYRVIEEELIQLKEESAKHITQISSLKSSNLKLTESLDEALDRQRSYQAVIDQLNNDLESTKATFNYEKVKLQETVSQQTKLIDFLQGKTEIMEKKRKAIIVPRLFGKKETAGTPNWRDTEVLEQEKTRCRRLQDLLSQARAENMALKNELRQKVPKTPLPEKSITSVPISPVSRAMHSALTSSPTANGDRSSPLHVTRETASKFMKLQGMKHRIPHRFTENLCMRGSKCAACLDSIHFGRPAAKCQECSVLCHPKCASSLPNTCGLPSGFIQHFKSAFHGNLESEHAVHFSEDNPHGWIKVFKTNKQGWERRYLRIEDSFLLLFEDAQAQSKDKAVDKLDFSTTGGEVVVISAVSPAELMNAAKSDLPFVLKIDYRPFTTCWPPRCLYLMADSFSDKQMWVSVFEALVQKYKRIGDESLASKLSGETVLKFKGDSCMDVLCTYIYNNNILLLGAIEGLFVISLKDGKRGLLKQKIEGVDSVYQIACSDIGVAVLISGEQRVLSLVKLSTLDTLIKEQSSTFSAEVEQIADVTDCHLFAIQTEDSGGTRHLCCATPNAVTLFRWDCNDNSFCKRKVIVTREPCSCIHFTQSSVIYGSDKFYELDLKTCILEEFLDCSDSSLAGVVFGVSQLRSFPISIFNVSCTSQAEEYLVCFHELGVFVDCFGQRTRPDDMKWSRLPLAFAYCAPYLFVTHFSSLEVIEILPRGKSESGIHGVMEIPNPQYLGPAVCSGAVYVSTSRDQLIEILCVDGTTVRQQNCEERSDTDLTGNASSESKGSIADGDDLDFSFSNSLIQSLDSVSCDDNLSVSS